jgi:hypothetical protein
MENATATSSLARGFGGIRRLFFVIGALLVGLALAAFAFELLAATDGGYRTIAAGELWFRVHPYSLNLCQAIVQRYLHPTLWDPVIITMLQWPGWSLLGAPGTALLVLFGPWMSRKG